MYAQAALPNPEALFPVTITNLLYITVTENSLLFSYKIWQIKLDKISKLDKIR